MAQHPEDVRYGTLDRAYVASLAALGPADDGPFHMLNLMRYREWADYSDDRPAISGRAADDLYNPLTILHDLGAEVVLFADVVDQLRGDEAWDRVAMVRYPSFRAFFEMQERPDFIAQHVHKDAGMDHTILAVCHPVAGSTALDPAGLSEGSGPGRRLVVDLVHGVDPDGLAPGPGQLVFRVDGAPVGDGRSWSALVVSTLPAEGPEASVALLDAPQGTSVTVTAYVKELP